MGYILLNLVPILLAALAAMAAGLVWQRGIGGPVTGARLALLGVAYAWIAAILTGALILAPVSAAPWTIALGSGGLIWGGFVLPAVVAGAAVRGLGWRAGLIDAGHWLVAMLVMAAALQTVGVTAPAAPAA